MLTIYIFKYTIESVVLIVPHLQVNNKVSIKSVLLLNEENALNGYNIKFD